MLPLIIHHDGRLGGTTRLFAESEDVQSTWKSKLEEAILLRRQSSRVFEVNVLAREEFLTIGGENSDAYPHEDRSTARTINSATPFGRCIIPGHSSVFLTTSHATLVTRDGRTLLAIGCTEGLWIGNEKNLRCRSLSITTRIEGITRIASLLFGASPPRPTMRSVRGIRSDYYSF